MRQLDHWIQCKDENTPFQDQFGNSFNLLLQGSRDGFTPADFHRLCDNKGATISVIKVKETGQLIGSHGPFGGLRYGPEFGWYNLHTESNDFQNAPGCYCVNNAEYEHAIMPNSENGKVDFFVEEYEVFQIRKL
ncbi:hypothetical protein G9A89_000136 [Geosiphon pyriformis]|nr:hypothetical protein G9A89_000136 [Geosiphon pyriformis]